MKIAEAVSKAHVDKVCDQISDAILDEYLKGDAKSRVAIETAAGHGMLFIVGEVTSKVKVEESMVAKKVLKENGCNKDIKMAISMIEKQSPNIAKGVASGGAGDQGIMIGYACRENEALIPQELYIARELIKKLPKGFGPDTKTQVAIDDSGKIDSIVISAQHQPEASYKPLEELAESYSPKKYFINPTGSFTLAGFNADSGLTGRKIVQDAYGPRIPVGGGAFSGKDGTKVDRSAAYIARKIAVDYLNKFCAKEVLVKIGYSIGVAEPILTEALVDSKEIKIKGYDLRPPAIIEFLGLDKPIFYKTAQNGHFGHNFAWDK